MAKVTVETKLPLTSGKEADLTLENGEVRFKFPVSWDRPTATLADLRAALDELEPVADPPHPTEAELTAAAKAAYEAERDLLPEGEPSWDEVIAEQGADGDFARARRDKAAIFLVAASHAASR